MKKQILFLTIILLFSITGCSNDQTTENLNKKEKFIKEQSNDEPELNELNIENKDKEEIEEYEEVIKIEENEDSLLSKEILTNTKTFMESLKWYENTFHYNLGETPGIDYYITQTKYKKDVDIDFEIKENGEWALFENKKYLYKNNGYYTCVYTLDKGWIKKDIYEEDFFKIDINYDYLINKASNFKILEGKDKEEDAYVLQTTLKYSELFNVIDLGIGNDCFNINKLKDIDTIITITINKWNFGLRKIDIDELVFNNILFDFNFLKLLIENKNVADRIVNKDANKLKLSMEFNSYEKNIIYIPDNILYGENGRIKNEFSDYISEFQFKDVYAGIEDLVLLDLSDRKEDFSITGMLGENEKCFINKEGRMIETLCEVILYKHNINYFYPEELHDRTIEVHEENLNINNRNIRYFKIKYDSNNSGFKLSGDFEKNHYVFIIEINNDYSLFFDFKENSRAENYIEVIASNLK